MLRAIIVISLLFVMTCSVFARGGGGGGGGCFTADTPILLATGRTLPIQQIEPGARVRAFDAKDHITVATVKRVFKHQVHVYYKVKTEHAILQVTAEHPVYVGEGQFKAMRKLHVGDTVFLLVKRILKPEHILSIVEIQQPSTVYNLQTDGPHTYFAAGVAVHNKGGSGGTGWRGNSGSRNDNELSFLRNIFGIVVLFVILGRMITWVFSTPEQRRRMWRNESSDDYLYPSYKIREKARKAEQLLTYLARENAIFSKEELQARVTMTFLQLQQCWAARDYTPMRLLMTASLFEEHNRKIANMLKKHEINCLDDLNIVQVDFVHVIAKRNQSACSVTALITASVKDYYIDDRTKRYLRGNKEQASFQEFWTYHYQYGDWVIAKIEQTLEASYLRAANVVDYLTDTQLNTIYTNSNDNALDY